MNANAPIRHILERARWAPSGDNTQVWRFRILDSSSCLIQGRWIGESCVYDLQGHASYLALGALLENIALAASERGLAAEIGLAETSSPRSPVFTVRLRPEPGLKPDPLHACIERRSVQRRPYRLKRLDPEQIRMLEAALPEGYRVQWFHSVPARLDVAWLMFRNAGVRLTMREAYEEHRKVIDWGKKFSHDKIPDQALAVDPLLRRLMRWAMQSWTRIDRLNRFAAGTWLPRIEMDLIPAIWCGAHFVLHAPKPPASLHDYVDAGRAMQRFWLQATCLGLQLQPETTPLIFAEYLRDGLRFTESDRVTRRAIAAYRHLQRLLGAGNEATAFFFGRIGHARPAESRSLRRPMEDLLLQNENAGS